MKYYQQMVLLVTTFCNRKCADCCYRIPTGEALGPAQHYSWDYFETAAKYLRGLDVLYVSGGEPTMHPEFPRIAQEFRGLFAPQRLILATNGAGVVHYGDLMPHFDEIWISNYRDEKAYLAQSFLCGKEPTRTRVVSDEHFALESVGRANPCERRKVPAYANGRIYPCCVAPGILGSGSIEPSREWEDQLVKLGCPCDRCIFAL